MGFIRKILPFAGLAGGAIGGTLGLAASKLMKGKKKKHDLPQAYTSDGTTRIDSSLLGRGANQRNDRQLY